MNILIPCSHCDRYVRSQEALCPFCKGVLAAQPARPVARAIVRNPSRAAAFALRTALVVAPAALACGDGTVERDADGAASSGGAGSSTTTASTEAGSGGVSATTTTTADGGDAADAGAVDAGFAPVAIYGGVFPDPVTRARV